MSSAAQQRTVHGYTLQSAIGEGSFGVVWKALAPGEFPAAVKFISRARDDLIALPELKALEAVRTLNSPYIVKVFACWEETDWLIIAMELADGNLRERFDCCRTQGLPGIPGDELLHYTREAADALDYLHGLNKLHRDIKPENLLLFLGTPSHCKVGDCGLVRDQDRIATMRPQGSPPFMPPEAWDCRPCPASDQFALAVSYAEMRLGRRPFGGRTILEMERAVRMNEPDLEGMFEAEAVVVRKALAKTPRERFETCRDFVTALEEAMLTRADAYRPRQKVQLQKEAPPPSRVPTRQEDKARTNPDPIHVNAADLPVTLVPPTARPAAPRPWPRWPAALAAGVLLAAVLGLVARSFLFPTPTPQPGPGPDPDPKPTAVVLPYPRELPPEEPPPLPPKPTLLPGYAAAEGAEIHGGPEGPWYATRIVRRVGDEQVVMRLIPGPAPFYVMENKVWNGLFERFTQDNPGRTRETWRQGGKADGDDVGVANRRHPALRMNRAEAEACAAWLGGRLPSAAQLDQAARHNDRPANADVAVGRRRDGPRPVGTSSGDRSSHGVYDLAGNGWEWTRDTTDGGELAVLRGRSYAASGPPSDLPLAQYPRVGSPYTGFRVVIELVSAP